MSNEEFDKAVKQLTNIVKNAGPCGADRGFLFDTLQGVVRRGISQQEFARMIEKADLETYRVGLITMYRLPTPLPGEREEPQMAYRSLL